MSGSDFNRKATLAEFGFRLPSCIGNRPLRFEARGKMRDAMRPQTVYVSATPGDDGRGEVCYDICMTKLEKIEQEIASLAPEDLHKLADWIAEYRDEVWDHQMRADAEAGRLDKFIAEAKAEIAAGKLRDL